MDKTPKQRIRALMDEQRHSYSTIAAEIGITPQAVSHVVNGKTTSSTARFAVATVLGVDVEELWPEEEAEAVA